MAAAEPTGGGEVAARGAAGRGARPSAPSASTGSGTQNGGASTFALSDEDTGEGKGGRGPGGGLHFAEEVVRRGDVQMCSLGRDKKWRKRWAVLKNDCLYYYTDRTESEYCGVVVLKDAKLLDWGRLAQEEEPPGWTRASECHKCGRAFSLLFRRHHCRNCGRAFCDAHSAKSVEIPRLGFLEPVRTCGSCYRRVNRTLRTARVATRRVASKTAEKRRRSGAAGGSSALIALFQMPPDVEKRDHKSTFALKTRDQELWFTARDARDGTLWIRAVSRSIGGGAAARAPQLPTSGGDDDSAWEGGGVGTEESASGEEEEEEEGEEEDGAGGGRAEASRLSSSSSSAGGRPSAQGGDTMVRGQSGGLLFTMKAPKVWTPAEVGAWLTSVGLGHLSEQFAGGGIDGKQLLRLKEEILRDLMGIEDESDRRTVLLLTAKLARKPNQPPGPPTPPRRSASGKKGGGGRHHQRRNTKMVASGAAFGTGAAGAAGDEPKAADRERRRRRRHRSRSQIASEFPPSLLEVGDLREEDLPAAARGASRSAAPVPRSPDPEAAERRLGRSLTHVEEQKLHAPDMASLSFCVGQQVAYPAKEAGGRRVRRVGVVRRRVFENGSAQDQFEVETGHGQKPRVFLASELLAFRSHRMRWQRGALLGKGAYGSVWSGLDTASGKHIAIKEMKLHGAGAVVDSKKTLNAQIGELTPEISLMQMLEHPNIVRFLGSEVDLDAHVFYIFMEKVSGGSIKTMIDSYGPLPEAVMANYAHQILDGLIYLHSNGVVHRDLKCCNVLITTEGVVKLADFGVSKKVNTDDLVRLGELRLREGVDKVPEKKRQHNTNLQTMIGSPYWMAPEVVKQAGYGRKADIWSFGCTLIEMASGDTPWAGYNQISACYAIGDTDKLPAIPAVSPLFEDFVRQCLRRDVEARPTATELLEHPWLASNAGGADADDE